MPGHITRAPTCDVVTEERLHCGLLQMLPRCFVLTTRLSFLPCLLAAEVAKFLQYASVVWLVSTSVADKFLLLFLVLVLAAIL